MGKLPDGPFEVRLAAILFLLLLGVADLFGAWQVKNFASFTPKGIAATVRGRRSPDARGRRTTPWGRGRSIFRP